LYDAVHPTTEYRWQIHGFIFLMEQAVEE